LLVSAPRIAGFVIFDYAPRFEEAVAVWRCGFAMDDCAIPKTYWKASNTAPGAIAGLIIAARIPASG